MSAFRLLVLDFVREYHGRWTYSPSHGEIAARLGSSRTRVRKALRSLARDDLIRLTPGSRGIALPEVQDEALRQLRALGWVVDPVARIAAPRANGALPPMPVLTYRDVVTQAGANDGGSGGEARSA